MSKNSKREGARCLVGDDELRVSALITLLDRQVRRIREDFRSAFDDRRVGRGAARAAELAVRLARLDKRKPPL
jgi:hypothetical protein